LEADDTESEAVKEQKDQVKTANQAMGSMAFYQYPTEKRLLALQLFLRSIYHSSENVQI
jgi:hypothetical protein